MVRSHVVCMLCSCRCVQLVSGDPPMLHLQHPPELPLPLRTPARPAEIRVETTLRSTIPAMAVTLRASRALQPTDREQLAWRTHGNTVGTRGLVGLAAAAASRAVRSGYGTA